MKSFKWILHEMAPVFIIVSIVVFAIPALFTVTNMLIPGAVGTIGVQGVSSVKSFLAAMCMLYYIVSLIPAGPMILYFLTFAVFTSDTVWRSVRGHRIKKKPIFLFAVAMILGIIAMLSDVAILQAFENL